MYKNIYSDLVDFIYEEIWGLEQLEKTLVEICVDYQKAGDIDTPKAQIFRKLHKSLQSQISKKICKSRNNIRWIELDTKIRDNTEAVWSYPDWVEFSTENLYLGQGDILQHRARLHQ